MADSLAALRTTVYTALNAALPTVHVSKYRRRPGTGQRHYAALELGVTASADGRPDLAEITLWLTLAGALQATEATLDTLTQAIEDALPASVAAPDWDIEYSQDDAVWRSTGTATAFRE